MHTREKSRQVACGGLFAALSVLCMLSAFLFPFATFAAPIAAGIALLPITEELGRKTAGLCYLAVSLLSILVAADAETAAMFVAFFGYYPILRGKIQTFPLRSLRLVIKLLLFNLAVCTAYCVLIFVFSLSSVTEGMSGLYWGVLLLLGNALFLCYDPLLGILEILYRRKLRPKLFHS